MISPNEPIHTLAPHSSQKLGIQIEQAKRNKKYFFQLNNHLGEGVLFSQPYSTQKASDNGIATVLKNLLDSRKIKRETQKGKHFFILKAGNHQEIGRSKIFDSPSEMEKYIALLQDHALKEKPGKTASQPIAPSADVIIATPKPLPRKAAPEKKLSAPKATFKISFYNLEGDNPLQGKIEYPFEETRQTFTGLDEKTIMDFIKKHLRRDQKDKPIPQKNIKKYWEEDLKNIQILIDNQPTTTSALKKEVPFDLLIPIPSTNLKKTSNTYVDAEIEAFVFLTGEQTMIGRLSGQKLTKSFIQVPVVARFLVAGIYRLFIKVTLKGESEKSRDRILKGSLLVQLY